MPAVNLQRHTTRWTAISIPCVLLAALTGCPPCSDDANTTPEGDSAPTSARLIQFDSAEAILQYARERQNASPSPATADVPCNSLFRVFTDLTNTGGILRNDDFGAGIPLSAPTTATGGESADSSETAFTGTNLQEAGVGEADVIQTDGQDLFMARRREIKIVAANPANELNAKATLETSFSISDMYLAGNTLIVLGYDYETQDQDPGIPRTLEWPPYFSRSLTKVAQYDVSDRSNPSLMAETTLDGSLATSRLVAERLVLVLTLAPTFNTQFESFEELAPSITVDGASSTIGSPDTWYYPLNPDGLFTTSVITLDATNVESLLGSLTVLAGSGTIYMSPEALYITDTQFDPAASPRPFTAVHKVTFNEQGVPEYAASGSLPGRLLNQFSLSEYEGNLRVASHVDDNQWFGWGLDDAILFQSNQPAADFNAVYVLAQDGENLEIVGRVENLAPDEDIYAARFMGPRGYVVTFRQVDPLFVLDLSDPADPQVLGELKIPGFSNYLHPVDENTLIGVGQSVDLTSLLTDGVQLSLFDVSDPATPRVIEQLTLGSRGSSTDVSYTHKAFAYLPDSKTFAFPATLFEDSFTSRREAVFAYQVDPNSGFSARAELSLVEDDSSFFYNSWRRAVIIDESLYALSDNGIRAVNFSETDTVFEINFAPERSISESLAN